jgi:hypothetical protein
MAEFEQSLEAAAAPYDATFAKTEPHLLEGRLDDAVALLVGAVPAKERTPAQAFVLGNMLFALAPETSARFHEEAWRARPEVPLVTYEWALQHHRARRYKEAEELYAQLVAGGVWAAPPVHALRADCLLHLGRHADAIAAWKTADVAKHHTEVEEAACWIYGPIAPQARRCAMLQRAAKGELGALEEAVLLDLAFDRDWWNVKVEERYLEHDLALARKAFGADSARWKELELFVRARRAAGSGDPMEDMLRRMRNEPPPSFDLKGAATAMGLLGEKARLPASSLIASNLFELFVEQKLATEAELGQQFGDELRRRGEAGDVDALEVLAAIYDATRDPRLAALDEAAWKKHGGIQFGGSLLASRAEKVRTDDPLLLELLAKHGDDPGVARIAWRAAQREKKPLAEAVARVAMADFQNMLSYVDTKAAMAELERELAKPKR